MPRARAVVHVGADLLNEFECNPFILCMGMPHLFPRGLPADAFRGQVPEATVKHLLRFHDQRFAESSMLLFFLYSQRVRHEAARLSVARVRGNTSQVQAYIDLVNESGFIARLQSAIAEPDGDDARHLTRVLQPALMWTSGRMPWFPASRKKVYPLLVANALLYGHAALFVTNSPSLRDDGLTIRLALGRTGVEPDHAAMVAGLPDARARARLILQNPVVDARMFHRRQVVLRATLFGLDDYRQMKRTLPLGDRRGIYGRVTAHCGCVEGTRNGGLHDHCQVHGTILRPDVLHNLSAEQVHARHASIIACGLHADVHARHAAGAAAATNARIHGDPPPARPVSVGLTQPPTTIAEAEQTAAEVVSRVNRHIHSATCTKENGNGKCRMAVKRRPAATTRIQHLLPLVADDTFAAQWADVNTSSSSGEDDDDAQRMPQLVADDTDDDDDDDDDPRRPPRRGQRGRPRRPPRRAQRGRASGEDDDDDDDDDDNARRAPRRAPRRAQRPPFMRHGEGIPYLDEARVEGGDQYIVEYSPFLTAALLSNTCVSALGSSTQATVATYVMLWFSVNSFNSIHSIHSKLTMTTVMMTLNYCCCCCCCCQHFAAQILPSPLYDQKSSPANKHPSALSCCTAAATTIPFHCGGLWHTCTQRHACSHIGVKQNGRGDGSTFYSCGFDIDGDTSRVQQLPWHVHIRQQSPCSTVCKAAAPA